MSEGGTDMNKVQRLALAAEIAPKFRRRAPNERRVHTTDADGNVVGHVTVHRLQIGILRRMAIEFDMGVKRRSPKYMATLRKAIEMCAAWPGATLESTHQALVEAGFVLTPKEVARFRPRPATIECKTCGEVFAPPDRPNSRNPLNGPTGLKTCSKCRTCASDGCNESISSNQKDRRCRRCRACTGANCDRRAAVGSAMCTKCNKQEGARAVTVTCARCQCEFSVPGFAAPGTKFCSPNCRSPAVKGTMCLSCRNCGANIQQTIGFGRPLLFCREGCACPSCGKTVPHARVASSKVRRRSVGDRVECGPCAVRRAEAAARTKWESMSEAAREAVRDFGRKAMAARTA